MFLSCPPAPCTTVYISHTVVLAFSFPFSTNAEQCESARHMTAHFSLVISDTVRSRVISTGEGPVCVMNKPSSGVNDAKIRVGDQLEIKCGQRRWLSCWLSRELKPMTVITSVTRKHDTLYQPASVLSCSCSVRGVKQGTQLTCLGRILVCSY